MKKTLETCILSQNVMVLTSIGTAYINATKAELTAPEKLESALQTKLVEFKSGSTSAAFCHELIEQLSLLSSSVLDDYEQYIEKWTCMLQGWNEVVKDGTIDLGDSEQIDRLYDERNALYALTKSRTTLGKYLRLTKDINNIT
ncbi:hypothetical protein [Vibrio barjaei]|uniref:hypothetical protein n=1 Tax=Vibrio barjaei TaxID=1676683 RepID=UPI002284A6AD|nr:hypothetical protein [Vibrio barjaei]MCY9870359.1 hypothetical protein [Vibrio barjaei]